MGNALPRRHRGAAAKPKEEPHSTGSKPDGTNAVAVHQCEETLPPSSRDDCSPLGRCCCLPKDRLQLLLLKRQLRRLHRALTTPFTPDAWNTVEHGWLLRSIWRNLRPGESYSRKGAAWKLCGFQGNDPATDVRGGGLLSVQCLAHFCEANAPAMRAMLDELEGAAAASPDGMRFYPLSTTAIVMVTKLCDALGVSERMRGPISARELEVLLDSPYRASISKMLIPSARRDGFFGLFSLLLVDFHVRFIANRTTYMMSQKLLNETFADLEKQAQRCRSFKELWNVYCLNPAIAQKLQQTPGPEAPSASQPSSADGRRIRLAGHLL
ncbi:hypothetical protein AB1Y20_021656 [Prymnesium parvum]|uniref:ELMO domain-containing protein n=1 Tax=Prymnesium parvum TaxID=97485 RepID=A0AB34JKT1_PRYPA